MIDFTMPGHLAEARSGPKLAIEPQQKTDVMKTSCASCARRRGLQRPEFTARERRQTLEKPAGGSLANPTPAVKRLNCLFVKCNRLPSDPRPIRGRQPSAEEATAKLLNRSVNGQTPPTEVN